MIHSINICIFIHVSFPELHRAYDALLLALNHFQSDENFLPLEVKGKYQESAVQWIQTLVLGNVFGEDIYKDLVEYLLKTRYPFMISATLKSFRTNTLFPPVFEKVPVNASQQLAMSMISWATVKCLRCSARSPRENPSASVTLRCSGQIRKWKRKDFITRSMGSYLLRTSQGLTKKDTKGYG